MVTNWAIIEEIDGIRTVMNIATGTEDVAKERGWFPADNLEIGMIEIEGKFQRPEKPKIEPELTEVQKLTALLIQNNVITETQAKGITRTEK